MKARKAMDLDAFECPICTSLFLGPIFLCKNGHAVCDACRGPVYRYRTCRSCLEPVVDIRCRPLEHVIAGMALHCSLTSHGEEPPEPETASSKEREAMELDALQCPICFSLMLGSIFQCENGHAVCDACRGRINGRCPSCREPVGDIRCLPLENAIAGMPLPCSFSSHGCTQLLRGTERRRHEEVLCQHAPLACPFEGCAYSGLLLYDHIMDAHARSADYELSAAGPSWWVWLYQSRPFKVLLDTVDRRVFLMLNGGDIRSGRSLSVVCLGPPPPAANESLEYKLEVRGGSEPGALSLSATGSVPCMRGWAGQFPTGRLFLFVPDAYFYLKSILVNVYVQKSTIDNNHKWTHVLE